MGKGPRPGGHFLRVFGAIPQLVLVFGWFPLGSFLGCLNVVLQTAPEWKNGSPMMLMMRVCWPQEAPNDAHDARLLAWIGIQEAPNDVRDVRLLAPRGTHDIPNDAYDHDSASGNGGH